MKEKQDDPFVGPQVPEISVPSFISKELKSGLALRRAKGDITYMYISYITYIHISIHSDKH